MTRRLYYDDCYLHEFRGRVVGTEGTKVYLDQTAFYPTSGGQPFDCGRIGPAEVIGVETATTSEDFIRRQNTFVLRVVGSSMVGDGILDGDYIVVEERPSAENGETVVATLNGEATVKRFYRERPGKIRLQPANDAMSPIIARDKDVEVRGVVVAVLRKY